METSAYQEKIDGSITKESMKKTWDGRHLMSGDASKQNCRHTPATNIQHANDLDTYYYRFDEHDVSAEKRNLHTSLSTPDGNIAESECEVREYFGERKPVKGGWASSGMSNLLI